ncbi:MAG: DUF1048 domain-containing protein [Coprobacillus sp.]
MKNDLLYDDYAKKLNKEYKEAYDQMSIYIEAAIIPGEDLSVMMNEVVDLLLSAQEDNRTIDSIIGNDMKYFCDQIIESHSNNITDKIFNFLSFYRILSIIAFALESFALVVDYLDGVKSPFTANVEMGGFVAAILISTFIMSVFKFITKHLVFKYKWYTKKLDNILTVIILISLFVGIIFLPEQVNSLVPLPRWLFLPLMIVIYVACTIRKKKEKTRDIQEGTYYSFDEVAYNANIETLRKRYNKYLKKCQKKNIQPKDVSNWYEERYVKDMRGETYGKIFFVLMVLIAIIGTIMTSELVDGIIFAIILLCIEIPIYRFLDKGRIARVKIHQNINEKQTDIFDDSLLIEDIGI